jgi:hypothetical protein
MSEEYQHCSIDTLASKIKRAKVPSRKFLLCLANLTIKSVAKSCNPPTHTPNPQVSVYASVKWRLAPLTCQDSWGNKIRQCEKKLWRMESWIYKLTQVGKDRWCEDQGKIGLSTEPKGCPLAQWYQVTGVRTIRDSQVMFLHFRKAGSGHMAVSHHWLPWV